MRSILVHADHDKANEVRLQTALDIARRLRAHLTLLIATPLQQFVSFDPFGGTYFAAEALAAAQAHFDEHQGCSVARDQINFARRPPPTPRTNDPTRAVIKLCHLFFGGKPCVIRPCSAHAPALFNAS